MDCAFLFKVVSCSFSFVIGVNYSNNPTAKFRAKIVMLVCVQPNGLGITTHGTIRDHF